MRRLLILMGVLGCGHRDPGRAARTAELAACTDAVEKAGAAGAGEQTEVVARGCTAACEGIPGWLAARAAATVRPGVLESVPSREAPPAPGLRTTCPAPGDGGAPESDEAIVLGAAARWIDRTARLGLSDPQLPARLEHVTTGAIFALPLPADPGVPASHFRAPPRARQFVVIGSELRVGTVPHVRLRGGKLESLAVPGAFPGQRVDAAQLGPTLGQHAGVLDQLGAVAGPVPLIIADATTPLSRVLDVITRLGVDKAEIGVAGADAIDAHPIILERRGLNVALPEIDLGEHGITLRGFGDDRETDWAHLDGELDNFAAVNAPIRALELHALPGTSVSDLVRILDACVIARVSALEFIPEPAPASSTR